MLALKDIHYFWGPQPVLVGASLTVARGEKAGLVGANGAGKTTLMRIAAAEITPVAGLSVKIAVDMPTPVEAAPGKGTPGKRGILFERSQS